MGQRIGVGLVELAILEAHDARRAWPGRRAASCAKDLATLEDELGLGRGYAYEVLIDLALPWKLPVPLVEPQGNFGSRGSDPPASPYHTEARLSPAGRVALAAECAQIAPMPLGLINGNTHRQGTRPPFRPPPSSTPSVRSWPGPAHGPADHRPRRPARLCSSRRRRGRRAS